MEHWISTKLLLKLTAKAQGTKPLPKATLDAWVHRRILTPPVVDEHRDRRWSLGNFVQFALCCDLMDRGTGLKQAAIGLITNNAVNFIGEQIERLHRFDFMAILVAVPGKGIDAKPHVVFADNSDDIPQALTGMMLATQGQPYTVMLCDVSRTVGQQLEEWQEHWKGAAVEAQKAAETSINPADTAGRSPKSGLRRSEFVELA